MLKQLDIGDKKVVVGDKCSITKLGEKNHFGISGTILSIWGFLEEENGVLIGLYSSVQNSGFSDLDGNVKSGHGLWITPSNFIANMTLIPTKYEILSYKFKNKNLGSMRCKMLHKYRDDTAFVELEENVGGGSCDGLGKAGHCVILPVSKLKMLQYVCSDKN